MSANLEGAVADAPENQEAGKQESDSLSVDAFEQLLQQEPERTPEETESETSEQGQEEEASEQESEESETSTEEESGFDLEALSEEERDRLHEALGGRAGKRISALTKRAKEAEEALAALNAQENQADPLAEDAGANPYEDITTIDDLRTQNTELNSTISALEEAIEDADGLMADDTIDVNGEKMTKKKARHFLRQARKAKEVFLPARLQDIRLREGAIARSESYTAAAAKELPWMSEKEGEQAQAYETLMQKPSMAKLKETDPVFWSEASYIIAHAINSIAQTRSKKPASKKVTIPKPKPPTSPSGAGAAGGKGDLSEKSAMSEQFERFEKEGATGDAFEALLLERMK